MGTLNRFFRYSPGLLRKMIYRTVPFGLRYGKQFSKRLRLLEEMNTADPEELREFQFLNLKILLIHVYENVAWYRDQFKEIDLHPSDIKTMWDWKSCEFPILTRADVKEHRHELIAEDLRWVRTDRHTVMKSSGSTGEPVQVLAYKDIYEDEAAFIERAYRANNSTLYFDKTVWLRRWCPDYPRQPLWYFDEEQQRLYMSAYHLNRRTVHEYIGEINKANCETLVAYPSSAYILACLVDELGLDPPKRIRHVQVSSEQLLPEWKQRIEAVLGVSCTDHYGQIEKVCLHHKCPGGKAYHDSVEYGLTEIMPDGKIIATGFLNYLMPLIRYDTGDYGIDISAKKQHCGDVCPHCGSTLPHTLKSIEGRQDDILETKDGNFLPGVNFYTMFYKIPGVRMFQLVQQDIDNLICSVVPDADYSFKTEQRVREELRKRCGPMEVYYQVVDEIERDPATGKIRCVMRRR